MNLESIVLGVIGSVLIIFLAWSAFSLFSHEARVERRRRKNNAKVVNRAGRPMVKLSAKTENKEGKTRK